MGSHYNYIFVLFVASIMFLQCSKNDEDIDFDKITVESEYNNNYTSCTVSKNLINSSLNKFDGITWDSVNYTNKVLTAVNFNNFGNDVIVIEIGDLYKGLIIDKSFNVKFTINKLGKDKLNFDGIMNGKISITNKNLVEVKICKNRLTIKNLIIGFSTKIKLEK